MSELRAPHLRHVALVVVGEPVSWAKLRALDPEAFPVVRCTENIEHITSLVTRLELSVLLIGSALLRQFPSDRRPQLLSNVSVVAVGEDDPEASADLIRTGCRGVIHPDVRPAMLRRVIESVLGGELWAPRIVLSTLIQEMLTAHAFPGLTSRQNTVLNLVRSGLTNQEIADQLQITRETVRWYVRELRGKVGGPVRKTAPHPAVPLSTLNGCAQGGQA